MAAFWEMLQLQLQLLLLMTVGMFVMRSGMADDRVRRSMSDMLVNIIIPCNILSSFMSGIEPTSDLLWNCVLAVVISAVIQAVAILGSPLLFRGFPDKRARIMTYGMILSNSSFIGIPVVSSIYGDLAVMYTSIFQIPIRITMWTSGLTLFSDLDRKEAYAKVIKHPCVISVALGFLLMLLQPPLPAFLTGTITSISRCTNAFSMMVIGMILAGTDWKRLVNPASLYYCLWRLILFPLMILVPLRLLGIDELLVCLSVILSAMPAGSITAIMAVNYDCEPEFAAGIVFLSTVLSALTIPLLCLLF